MRSLHPLARELIAAVTVKLILIGLLFFFFFDPSLTPLVHSIVVLLLLSVCGSFVHGDGFVPRNRLLRWLCSPLITWPSIALTGVGAVTLSMGRS